MINNLYKTKIECSTYNAEIDSDDTEVIITLIDFNNQKVVDKDVTITCSQGYFTSITDNTHINSSLNNVTDINGTTNSKGEIRLKYTASEWGLATIQANDASVQINVDGWRKYVPTITESGYSDTTRVSFSRNKNTCIFYALIHSEAEISTSRTVCDVPEECRPKTEIRSSDLYASNYDQNSNNEPTKTAELYITLQNAVHIIREGGTNKQPTVRVRLTYHLED